MKFNEKVEYILNELLDTKTELSKKTSSNKRKYFKYDVKVGETTLHFEGKYDSDGIWSAKFDSADKKVKVSKPIQILSWMLGVDPIQDIDVRQKYKDYEFGTSTTKPSLIQILNGFKTVIDQFAIEFPNNILHINIPDVGNNNDLLRAIQKLAKKLDSTTKSYSVKYDKNKLIITPGA